MIAAPLHLEFRNKNNSKTCFHGAKVWLPNPVLELMCFAFCKGAKDTLLSWRSLLTNNCVDCWRGSPSSLWIRFDQHESKNEGPIEMEPLPLPSFSCLFPLSKGVNDVFPLCCFGTCWLHSAKAIRVWGYSPTQCGNTNMLVCMHLAHSCHSIPNPGHNFFE